MIYLPIAYPQPPSSRFVNSFNTISIAPVNNRSQTLTWKVIPQIDDALKADVIKWSAFYEHRIRLGSVRTYYFAWLGFIS